MKDLAKLQNDARTILVQVLGGAFLLIGLYLTLRNLQLTQDKQITEHYTRAVEQLGSDKLAVRLGAIYALERIARDSERDHWPIMEILTAYVRENASWKEEELSSQEDIVPSETQPTQSNQSPSKLAHDIQALLTVLGRRARTYRKGEDQALNLVETDLRQAVLVGAHLEQANLGEAHLERVGLVEAHLEGANLERAHLEEANLQGAHLHGAENLTVEQLSTVKTLYDAHLDPPLLAQIQQQYPHLLEKPQEYRCRYCGAVLPVLWPVTKRLNGAIVIGHLNQDHPDQVGPYLARMRTEDIATVAAEAYEVVE